MSRQIYLQGSNQVISNGRHLASKVADKWQDPTESRYSTTNHKTETVVYPRPSTPVLGSPKYVAEPMIAERPVLFEQPVIHER